MSVTRRTAVGLVLCAVLALFVAPVVVLAVAAALMAAVAVDVQLARRPLMVRREFPHTLARGVPVALVAHVDGNGAKVRLRQPLPPDLLVTPAISDTLELHAQARALRRGRHVLPALAVAADGPLGLGRWLHRPGDEQEFTVYPDLPAAWRLVESMRRGGFSDPGQLIRGPLGLGTEFESVREYRPDDDFRQINWRATARTGQPMSNNYRIEQDRDVICCVDTGRLMASPIGDATRLDLVFDAVVTIALIADELGDRCGLVAFSDTVRRVVPPGRKGSRGVIDGCVDLEPVLVDSDFEAAFQRVAGGKRSLVLVLTDLVEPSAARPLIDAVPVLTRRHAVVVASVDDPELRALSEPPTDGDAVSAARATLATDMLRDRDRVVAELRRAGAIVVTAPPNRLTAACVEAYVRTKRMARV